MTPRHRHLIQLGAGALLAVTLLGVFALVAWSDQPAVRYASLKCVYRQIYNYRGPVDVVVVGTSRTKWGVSPQEVSTVMSNGATPPLTVLNLARSWRGTQQMFQEIKDVEAERGIRRAIVVEYSREGDVEATSQRYYDYYPDHAALVPIDEFKDDPQLKPREPAYLRARDLMDLVQERLDFALDRLLSNKNDANVVIPTAQRPLGVSDGCTGPDRPYKPAANASWAAKVLPKNGTWEDRPPVPWTIGAINNDAQRESMLQLVAWARAHHLRVYFTLMPRFLDPEPSQAYFEEFRRTFGVPLLFPPKTVLGRLYDGGYSDPNHLYAPGRAVYSRWLAEQLR
ncbi:MAG: hypothetical protein ACR2JV_02115 [Gaiellales bacterium]